MTKRAVIDFADLRFLSLECGKCGAKTVLDIERLLDPAHRGVIPQVCPSCETSFDPVKHAIGKFIRVYGELAKGTDRIRFEINDPGQSGSTQI